MPSPFRPTANSPDTTARAIERLQELSVDHRWIELRSCLNCLDSNHWKVARRYRLNVHVIHSLEHLCCERPLMMKAEIEEFLRVKILEGSSSRQLFQLTA